MTKKKFSNRPKNSKSVTTPPVIKKQEEPKFTPETTAIVTFKEHGAFKCRVSNSGTKEQKEKMRKSWCYLKLTKADKTLGLKPGEYQSKDGVQWFPLKPGQKPRNYYEGPKTYNPPIYHECLKQMHLNAATVAYYISDESCPGRSKKERAEWDTLSKYQRFCRNVAITANNCEVVSIKVVD